jgi:Glycosyltransferase (GlcNAc)
LCEILWHTQIRNQQAKALRRMIAPKLTTTWGAGYSFSKCHAMRAVPYDPYLPQVFDGEEFSMYARYFTHGYDVYTPSRSYIGHDYNGANNPNAGSWHVTSVHDKAAEHIASNKRLWTLLDMPGGDTGEHAKVSQSYYFQYMRICVLYTGSLTKTLQVHVYSMVYELCLVQS